MRWIVEVASPQFLPVAVGKPVGASERFPDVGGVFRVRSFGAFRVAQNFPVHHRAIRDALLNPWVERGQDRGRAAETPADHKYLLRIGPERLPEGHVAHALGQFIDHVQYV